MSGRCFGPSFGAAPHRAAPAAARCACSNPRQSNLASALGTGSPTGPRGQPRSYLRVKRRTRPRSSIQRVSSTVVGAPCAPSMIGRRTMPGSELLALSDKEHEVTLTATRAWDFRECRCAGLGSPHPSSEIGAGRRKVEACARNTGIASWNKMKPWPVGRGEASVSILAPTARPVPLGPDAALAEYRPTGVFGVPAAESGACDGGQPLTPHSRAQPACAIILAALSSRCLVGCNRRGRGRVCCGRPWAWSSCA